MAMTLLVGRDHRDRSIRAAAHRRAERRRCTASPERRRAAVSGASRAEHAEPLPRPGHSRTLGALAQQQKGGDPVSYDQPRFSAAVTRIPALAEVLA
jgi:hypothetical protein